MCEPDYSEADVLLNFKREDMILSFNTLEKIISLIDIFGFYKNDRQGRAWDDRIRAILSHRTTNDFNKLTDVVELEIANRICVALSEAASPWKSTNFYLEDKINCIICWDTGDFCEVEALTEIEDEFDFKFSDSDISGIMQMSLREFIGYIKEHSPLYNNKYIKVRVTEIELSEDYRNPAHGH